MKGCPLWVSKPPGAALLAWKKSWPLSDTRPRCFWKINLYFALPRASLKTYFQNFAQMLRRKVYIGIKHRAERSRTPRKLASLIAKPWFCYFESLGARVFM